MSKTELDCRKWPYASTTLPTALDDALKSSLHCRLPEGWQWVPKEPTKEMLDAAANTPGIKQMDGWAAEMQIARGRTANWGPDNPPLLQVWTAMLAAAMKGPTDDK